MGVSGWEGSSRGGDMGILTANSRGCTAETHNVVKQLYSKNKYINKN